MLRRYALSVKVHVTFFWTPSGRSIEKEKI